MLQLLPDRMYSNVRLIAEKVRNEDWDWLIAVDGRERVGKTAISVRILFSAEPILYRYVLCADYSIPLGRFAWDFDDMLDIVKLLPRGRSICYQEASMLGREAMRTWNTRMVRVMTTIGNRNILYILTFPRFTMLDPYLRYRARTRVYVRTHHGARGYARCYYRATMETDSDDGLRFAYDTTFRDVKNDDTLAEFWYKLMEKEDRVKMEILTRHGRREKEV